MSNDQPTASQSRRPAALLLRGIAWLQADQPDKALADFDRAAELAPDDPAPLFNRGLVYRCQGRFPEAIADFTSAACLAPDDPDPILQRGNVLLALGDHRAAATDFRSVLSGDPYNPEAMNRLAGVLSVSDDELVRDPENGLRLARRAMEFAEEVTADLRDTLAAACAACGRFAEAVFWQNRALQSAPTEEHPAYLRRLRFYRRGVMPPTNRSH